MGGDRAAGGARPAPLGSTRCQGSSAFEIPIVFILFHRWRRYGILFAPASNTKLSYRIVLSFPIPLPSEPMLMFSPDVVSHDRAWHNVEPN
jgi:hypothetical protein